MNNRVDSIDIAKGLVIISMVLGHSSLPAFAHHFIYAFHMPFFFFVSGMTTNFTKHNLLEFTQRKAMQLLLPLFIYSLLIIPFMLKINNQTITGLLSDFIVEGYKTPLWFVPVFYVCLILAKIILRIKDKFALVGIVVLLFSISTLLNIYAITLPWSMAMVPFFTSWVILGRCLSDTIMPRMVQKFNISEVNILFGSMLITLCVSHLFVLDPKGNGIIPLAPILLGILGGGYLLPFNFLFS